MKSQTHDYKLTVRSRQLSVVAENSWPSSVKQAEKLSGKIYGEPADLTRASPKLTADS
jgi:hypothetical protein